MKRIVIGLVLLTAGASIFCGFRSSVARLRQECGSNVRLWQSLTQNVAQARSKRLEMEECVHLGREQLKSWQQLGRANPEAVKFMRYYETGDFHLFLPPETSETLLAELGFNWNSTGDFVVVSKATLHGIDLNGLNRGQLSDAAAKVLALEPAERTAIEDLAQQAGHNFKQWVTAHVQRTQPEEGYLMQLTIPANPSLSLEMRNRFTNGVVALLGANRGEVMLKYASAWMHELNMLNEFDAPTTVQVHRIGRWGKGLESELVVRRGGGINSIRISPEQPVPLIVSFLYSGGWEELAASEGFELSEKFKNYRR